MSDNQEKEKTSFFDKVKSSARSVKKKASDSMEQSRLRSQIRQLEERTGELYKAIGERVYRSAGSTVEKESFGEELSEIAKNYQEQQELYFRMSALSEFGEDAPVEEKMEQLEQAELEAFVGEAMAEQAADGEPTPEEEE